MASVSWLHLSDLHRGMTTQEWLWPNIEADFFDDLRKLHDRSRPWDLILFTGDLTQRGQADEFDKLNETLGRLYQVLEELGSNPILLVVPGNHDLARPKQNDPVVKLLKEWSKHSDIQEEFWRENNSPYRRIVEESFASYTSWWLNHPFPKPENLITGLLPGDFSATIKKDEVNIGIIGLNITFLQLTEGNYKGKLAVSPLQVSRICGEHYEDWFRAHDVNMLMTHQPPSWLHPNSKNSFDGEIYRPGRFIAHMYGHMHEYQNYNITMGGAKPKRYWQGCSLFGLEYYGSKKKVSRRHGYSLGRIETKGDTGQITLWPRKAEPHQAGHLHIVADSSSTLTDGMTVETIKLPIRGQSKPALKGATTTPFRVLLLATDMDLLEARNAVAEYLRRALGVDTTTVSAFNPPEFSNHDLVILLQGWWWDKGGAINAWQKAPSSRRLAFIVNEDSEWPPRRLTELAAGTEISKFRATLANPQLFNRPEDLPEKVGAVVTTILQSRVGDDGMGLQDWERTYISFRLPAWTSGRTALSSGYLLEAENAEELYQADLYVALDGTSRNWQRGPHGRPKRIPKRKRNDSQTVTEQMAEKRVRLGRWLSIPNLPHIALVGAPGGGKTVVLTRTAAAIANGCLGRPIDFEPDIEMDCLRHHTGMLPIPVVLEATRIAKYEPRDINALMAAMADEMAATGEHRPSTLEIQKGLKSGRYYILIDALDEVADSTRRSQVLDLLKGMASPEVFPNTRVVLTTRSARYTGSLRFAPELETVEVAPLDEKQVQQLCNNWARHRDRDSEYTHSLMSAVSGLAEQVSSSTEDQALTENPLMLTAICMVFERYRSLPDDRGRLCELLIDDLCRSRNSEDPARGWKLDDSTKKDLLQRIAHAMQEEGAQAWSVSSAIKIATTLIPTDEKFIEQRAKKYLDWAADHTGLLRFQQDPDGEEQIRFWHRLFREYLCANRLAQLDKTAVDMVDHLWKEKRLENPFWEDVIRLLPRALGTIEKARSMRERLEELALENDVHRGRLLGLSTAGIIENRDLYPDIKLNEKATQLADIYEAEGLSWPLRDRLLFLEGLGRLDPKSGDPRFHKERWIKIPAGRILLGRGEKVPRIGMKARQRAFSTKEFFISWAPVTVQEYRAFVEAPDVEDPQFWAPVRDLEVTRSETDSSRNLMDRIKKQARHPNWPVTNVSLREAIAFCLWRTIHRTDGHIVRLLTEAEWYKVRGMMRNLPHSKESWEEILQLGDSLVPVGATSLRLPEPFEFPGWIYQWCMPLLDGERSNRPEGFDMDRTYVYGLPLGFRKELSADTRSLGHFDSPPSSVQFRYDIIGFRCALVSKST